MVKHISCLWKSKESWSRNTHFRQNRLLDKDYYKRQGIILHNDQGINPTEDVTIVNIHTSNMGTSRYVGKMLTVIKEKSTIT